MKNKTKNIIREIVWDIMGNKVTSLVNDIYSDNEVRDRVMNDVPEEISNDEEFQTMIMDSYSDGIIDQNVISQLIDELTDSFMGRFNK